MQHSDYENTLNAIITKKFASWPRAKQEKALRNKGGLYNHSVTHEAALNGLLDQIPPALLTEELLNTKNENHTTPVHLAATNGHLHQLPPAALNSNTLLTNNPLGQNALHKAAQWNNLDQIPTALLTEENLLRPDHHGNSPLDWNNWNRNPHKLRKKIPLQTLKALLKNPQTPKDAKTWMEKEARTLEKEHLRAALQQTNHTDL